MSRILKMGELPALEIVAAGRVVSEPETGRISSALRRQIRKKYAQSARASDFQLISLAAVDAMLADGGEKIEFTPRTALVVASVLGPQDKISGFQDDLLDYPEEDVMAGLFSHSVHNAPAGGLSMAFNLTGPSFSVTGMDRLFEESFRLSSSILETGEAETVLLITGEMNTPVADALRKLTDRIPGEEICAFFLKKPDDSVGAVPVTPDPASVLSEIFTKHV